MTPTPQLSDAACDGEVQPLQRRLEQGSSALEMSFDDIADVVGGLPASAYTTRSWWANDETHVQARAWLGAHRRVESVDFSRRRVQFSSRSR